MVGKYCDLSDSYLSVLKALTHSGIHLQRNVNIVWIESTDLEDKDESSEAFQKLMKADGVVVPGGFGTRGVEGKIIASKYCRENGKPYLGVCLGMQVMVMEYARHVLGIEGATSEELTKESNEGKKGPSDEHAIVFMPEGSKTKMGGTMRLGSRETIINADTLANKVYAGSESGTTISERHRHRYEVNPDMI